MRNRGGDVCRKIVELQSVRGLFYHPQHPYTKALLYSIPKLGTKAPLHTIPGQSPDLSALPQDCIHPRCPLAMERCSGQEPKLVEVSAGHQVACYLY